MEVCLLPATHAGMKGSNKSAPASECYPRCGSGSSSHPLLFTTQCFLSASLALAFWCPEEGYAGDVTRFFLKHVPNPSPLPRCLYDKSVGVGPQDSQDFFQAYVHSFRQTY